MRQLKITLIVLLGVIMLGLFCILRAALKGSPWIKSFSVDVRSIDAGDTGRMFTWEPAGEYKLVQETEIPADGIRSLKIDYGASAHDVLIYRGTEERVIVREYMNYEPKEDGLSAVERNGTELEIRGARENGIFFFFGVFRPGDAYTEILLPESLAGQFKSFSAKTVSGSILSEAAFSTEEDFEASSTSGDIFFPRVAAQRLRAHSTSGDVRMAAVRADRISLSATSGDIMSDYVAGELNVSVTSGAVFLGEITAHTNISSVSGDISLSRVTGDMNLSVTSGDILLREGRGSLSANSVSGDIRAENLDGSFELSTTSGTLFLNGEKGFGKVKSVSGDIDISLREPCGDLDISTTSGTVELKLPEEASFTFGFSSTSGECVTFFDDGLTFSKRGHKAEGQRGSGGHAVKISTVSGDLSVAKYGTLQYNQ